MLDMYRVIVKHHSTWDLERCHRCLLALFRLRLWPCVGELNIRLVDGYDFNRVIAILVALDLLGSGKSLGKMNSWGM